MLTALVVALSPRAIDAIDRFEAYMVAASRFETQFEASVPGNPFVGSCRLLWLRPADQLFSCKWQANDFEFRQNSKGWIELDKVAKQYAFGPPEPISQPTGVMSRITDYAYPAVLLSGSLTKYVNRETWQYRGEEIVNGVKSDRLFAKIQGGDESRVEAWIDATGAMRRWHIVQERPAGIFDVQFDFKSVKSGVSIPSSAFDIEPPVEYMPRFLPTFDPPLSIGTKFPSGEWTDARTGKTIYGTDVVGRNLMLVFFTAGDCDVSTSAEKAFQEATEIVVKKGGVAFEFIAGTAKPTLDQKASSRQLVRDESGAIAKAANITSTPTVLLVGRDGAIAWEWIGYDLAKPKALAVALHKYFSEDQQ